MKTICRKLAVLALVGALPVRAELVDRVAAVVNEEVVTLSDVEKRAAAELPRVNAERDPQRRARLRQELMKAALDAAIGDKLLEAQLKEEQITVTDAELDTSLRAVREQNNLDADQFEAALGREGHTMASYREFLRKQLARMKLMDLRVRSRVKISDADLQAEYAKFSRDAGADFEVKARHLLVQVPAKATKEQVEAARKKAEELAAEARRPGVDFAELARTRSEGSSAADGGDLGYFKRGVMVAEFEKTAFSLEPGGVSDPIRTSFGWHVIKVEERRASNVPPFEEVKEQMRDRLYRAQLESYSQRYVQELRQAATIEVRL